MLPLSGARARAAASTPRARRLRVAAAFVASVLGTTGTTAAEPAAPGAGPDSFRPTPAQLAALKIAPVALAEFRPEHVTEGNIALDDDLTTPVFSPYSGRVVRLIARLGDRVAQGAPLFAVEASEFVQGQNDLITALGAQRTARAQLSQAQTNEKRGHDLFRANGGALKDWQQAQTDLAAAQNAARTAEIALAAARNRLRILGRSEADIAALESAPTQALDPTATVVAPIAGTVTQRQIGLGQYINSAANGAANPVYTIGDLSTVWLIGNVREADASLVRIGTPVEVRVPAYPDRVFTAKISWIAPAIDTNTRRLPVRAEIADADGALKPAMFAVFNIITGDPVTAPAVPRSAVVYEGDAARVWVAGDDGTIASRAVTTGQTSDGKVEILSGLAAGEKIVTSGTLFIDRAASAD